MPATCVECGKDFEYRLRGKPQVTCSDRCRIDRRARLTVERMGRWALRRTPVGALGYPERLSCRSVTDNASQGEPCDGAVRVLYVDGGDTAYLLCTAHDTTAAAEAAEAMHLRRVNVAP